MTGINQHSLIEQSRTHRIEYVGEKQRLEEENLTADGNENAVVSKPPHALVITPRNTVAQREQGYV